MQNRASHILALMVAALFLLSGCAATVKPQFVDETIDLSNTVISQITLETGVVDGMLVPGYGKIVRYHYDRKQQENFVDRLQDALERQGASIDKEATQGLKIHVNFVNTFYYPQTFGYLIELEVDLEKDGETSPLFYRIHSRELQTYWEALSHSPIDSRRMVESTLRAYMVSDIERFMSGLSG